MIDTIKLAIPLNKPLEHIGGFQPSISSVSTNYYGYFKAVSNPTSETKRNGIYQPRLTYVQRPVGLVGAIYELIVELSLPKIVYGNNFDELADNDFKQITISIKDSLSEMGISISDHQIENAEVRMVHYSKNFILKNYTSCLSVINILSKADISKTYDIQKTDFRNGGYVLHVHTNSLDIAIYDKVADLKQSRISEKRCIEKDNFTQTNLLDLLNKRKPLSIMRYEVRLNSKNKVKKALSKVGFDEVLIFKNVYSNQLSKKILQDHWQTFFSKITKISLDNDKPSKIFANIVQSNIHKTARQSLTHLGVQMLLVDSNQRYIRGLIENSYGIKGWNQIKPFFERPKKVQYKSIIALNIMMEDFRPTRMNQI